MKTSKSAPARALALVVAALTLFAAAASAAEPPSLLTDAPDARSRPGFSLGGQASYYRNNKVIDNDWYPGADLRLTFVPAFSLDASTDYRRSHSINNYPTQVSAMVYLAPQYRLTPYIMAGGTWYLVGGTGANREQFGPHAGAGLEYFMTREWSVDGNWRYLWVEKANSGQNYFNRTYNTNGYQVRVGLHYHF